MKKQLLCLLFVISGFAASSQCYNTSNYGTIFAPNNGFQTSSGNCMWASEYIGMSSASAGETYSFSSTVATDYLTITYSSQQGALIYKGPLPAVLAFPASGYYYLHLSANSSCASDNSCRVLTVKHVPCGGVPPMLQVNVAPSPVCAGKSTTFTASGASSYTWFPGGVAANPAYAAPQPGISYTVLGGPVPCAGGVVVTPNVQPAPSISVIKSSSFPCAGTQFSISANGATSYTWFPGGANGAVYTGSHSAVTVYTVFGTSSSGCIGGVTTTVGVTPGPNITAGTTSAAVCAGNTTTLNASGAISYTWAPGNFTLSTFTVAPSASTVYTVTGVAANGCPSTQIVPITAHPLPNVVITPASQTMCVGGSNTLTASGATSYKWLSDFTTNSTLVVTATSTLGNNYSVLATDDKGCQKETSITLTVLNCASTTGITGVSGPAMPEIYPNPNNGTFSIRGNEKEKLLIYNVSGQLMLQIPAGTESVNVSELPDGIYLIKASETADAFRKLVITR